MKNIVYIAGAGTGDMGLVTVKTMDCIKEADVIVYDRLINKNLLLNAREDVKLIYVGKENTAGGKIQERINEILVEEGNKNLKVLRLKGGDPYLYGRGGEEALYLKENGLSYELIPGITSPIAVSAYAGIPVTHRGLSSELHVFTAHGKDGTEVLDYSKLGKLDGTLIFLMGVGKLPHIQSELIKNGKDPETPAAVIENGTRNIQRTVTGNLQNIYEKAVEEGIKPPSIILIGNTVNLRDELMYFEKQELFGKRIAVTRSKKQSLDMVKKLESLGAYVIAEDFIAIERKDFKLPNLNDYAMIGFNSANGVKYFMEKIDDIRVLGAKIIGAVGDITEKELMKYKLKADIKPHKYMVNELVKESVNHLKKGDRVLIITSDISPIDYEKISAEYGIDFDKIEVYSTIKVEKSKEEIEKFFNENPEIIIFLSSSTVRSFFENIRGYEDRLDGIEFASIGPVTSRTIREYGYEVHYEAEVYTVEGMLEQLKK